MSEIRTFTPSSLSEALANCEITAAEKQLVRVHGVLQDVQSSTIIWNNEPFRRGKLCDTKTKQLLNITVKPNENLRNFDECILEGSLDGWIPPTAKSEIKITLYFRVTKVIAKGKYKISENEIKIVQRKTELVDLCSRKIYKNITSTLVDLIEHRQYPQIAVIYGKQSYTWEDIEKSLKGSEKNYNFIRCEVNLSEPKDIIGNLKKLDERKYNLICLYRGGGDNLDIFNNLDIAECIINLKTPFTTAIGHARDHPFIQAMADRVFETPSAIGTYLQNCSRDAFSISRRLKQNDREENELNPKVKKFNEPSDDLQISINKLLIALSQFKELKTISKNQILLFTMLGIVIGISASFAFPYLYEHLMSIRNQITFSSGNSNAPVNNQPVNANLSSEQNANNFKVNRSDRR